MLDKIKDTFTSRQLICSNCSRKIEEGIYSGWDDPRLGTLRAIARRGIQAEAITKLMVEIGVKMADSAVSWKKIYGLNRNIIEEKVNRYFFVKDPVKIAIADCPDEFNDLAIERPLHPDFLDRGNRNLVFNKEVYIPKADLTDGITRLMDAVNVEIADGVATYHSSSFEDARDAKARIIQWVGEDAIKTKVVMDDASVVEGLCEIAAKTVIFFIILSQFGRIYKFYLGTLVSVALENDYLVFALV